MDKLKIIYRPIGEVSPASYNPRDIDDASFAGLKESLKKFGLVDPLIINVRSGLLVGGHQRLKAAEALGWTEVPTVEVDLSPAQEKALNVTLNNHKISGHYSDALGDLLEEIKIDFSEDEFADLRLDDLLIDFPATEEEKTPQSDEDEVPEHVEPRTKPGDIYQLGKHRLMCGDSTSIDAVEKLMNGEKAQTFFTDPPYGDNVGGLRTKTAAERVPGKGLIKRASFIANDKDIDWLEEVFNLVPGFLEDNSTKMVFFKWDKFEQIKKMASAFGEPSALCVWNRVRKASAFFRFQPQHELCFHWGNQADKKESSSLSNVWSEPKELENKELHPTVKPIAIIEPVLKVTTEKGKGVLDLFGGSGSTLIAAEKTNRKAYLMELDPKYCDVIVARWEKYTGEKADLV